MGNFDKSSGRVSCPQVTSAIVTLRRFPEAEGGAPASTECLQLLAPKVTQYEEVAGR